MLQACAVFILLCVCLLDLATEDMEKLCPVFTGDRLALCNDVRVPYPGCEG